MREAIEEARGEALHDDLLHPMRDQRALPPRAGVNRSTAKQLVLTLNAVFPPPLPKLALDVYVNVVAGFADEQAARDTFEALLLDPDAQWMPKPGEIRDAYRRVARIGEEHRQALERERAAELAESHGLPAGASREPIPAETVTWLRRRGVEFGDIVQAVPDEPDFTPDPDKLAAAEQLGRRGGMSGRPQRSSCSSGRARCSPAATCRARPRPARWSTPCSASSRSSCSPAPAGRVRREDYLELLERCTYRDDRVRPT